MQNGLQYLHGTNSGGMLTANYDSFLSLQNKGIEAEFDLLKLHSN